MKKFLIILSSLFFIPSVFADAPSYTDFNLSKGTLKLDYDLEEKIAQAASDSGNFEEPEVNINDGSILNFEGSVAIGENFHVFGGYSKIETDGELSHSVESAPYENDDGETVTDIDIERFDGDLDGNLKTIGIGYHRLIADSSTFHVNLSYMEAKLKASGEDDDGTTYSSRLNDYGRALEVGFRSNLNDNFELAASVTAEKFEDVDYFLSVDATYYLDNGLGFTLGTNMFSDRDGFSIGVRYRL